MAGGGGNTSNANVSKASYMPNMGGAVPRNVPNPTAGLGQNYGVTGSTQPNAFTGAATDMNLARGAYGQAASYAPQQLANTNLQPYMNPYTQNVIDASMGDIDRMRQMSLNNVGAQATSAGAFGGSRQGVMEAETNRAAMEQAGTLGSQLRQQGFGNAQQGAQFDINNMMAGNTSRMNAAQGLAGLSQQGFNYGQTVNDNLSRQGALQQALQQQLIDASKGQYQNFVNAPTNSLQSALAALGVAPNVSTQTTTKSPGLFDFLSLGVSMM